jgi:hypothetical protein
MQTPLNTAERSSAFWKFFFFFFIAAAMIVTAVYFNFKMPLKENELLKAKAEEMRLQTMAQEKFTTDILKAKALLDSMSKPGINTKLISNQVSDIISTLTNIHITDNSIQGGLDKAVLEIVLDYNKLKEQMVNSGDSQAQIAELSSKNNQLMNENDQLRRDIGMYQRGTGR